MQKVTTIDEYINLYPVDVQKTLQKIRKAIQQTAPEAREKISYGLATFTLSGNLVHFGAYDTHIGFYPGPKAVEAFKDRLGAYKTSKGTIQFPLDKPVPLELIGEITLYCVRQRTPTK